MRSQSVFANNSRQDGMEIETRKWSQTTRLVKPVRKICILLFICWSTQQADAQLQVQSRLTNKSNTAPQRLQTHKQTTKNEVKNTVSPAQSLINPSVAEYLTAVLKLHRGDVKTSTDGWAFRRALHCWGTRPNNPRSTVSTLANGTAHREGVLMALIEH